jgi:hypothetical protein
VRRGPADSCQHGRKKRDHLVLRTDITLLKDLEIPEFGRPVALGSVFVGGFFIVLYLDHAPILQGSLTRLFYRMKQSKSAAWSRCSSIRVAEQVLVQVAGESSMEES